MSTPIKGQAYEFPPVSLVDIFDPAFFLASPTIIAGDFKIQKDFGAIVNLASLPVVTPFGSSSVKVNLSAVEMTADKIGIFGRDQGSLWGDINLIIDVSTGSIENAVDILEGDRTETKTNYKIRKKGTAEVIVDKDISGSLLPPEVVIITSEA